MNWGHFSPKGKEAMTRLFQLLLPPGGEELQQRCLSDLFTSSVLNTKHMRTLLFFHLFFMELVSDYSSTNQQPRNERNILNDPTSCWAQLAAVLGVLLRCMQIHTQTFSRAVEK